MLMEASRGGGGARERGRGQGGSVVKPSPLFYAHAPVYPSGTVFGPC